MDGMTPFRFEWGDYPARHFHPLSKLGTILALSIGASIASPVELLVLGIMALGVLAFSGAFARGMGAGATELIRDARFLLPLGLFITLFRMIDFDRGLVFRLQELGPAVLYIGRLAALFAFAEAFFRSTSTEELASATTKVSRSILKRGDIDPGLYVSLAVGFIPRCFEAYGRTREAAHARGYGAGRPGSGSRLRASAVILEAFIASTLRGAIATSEALEARGYSPSRTIDVAKFRNRDALLLSAASAVAILIAIL